MYFLYCFLAICVFFCQAFTMVYSTDVLNENRNNVSYFTDNLLQLMQQQNSTTIAMNLIFDRLKIAPITSNKNNTLKCFTRGELMILLDINNSSVTEQFVEMMSPVVLQQSLSNACVDKIPDHSHHSNNELVFAYAFGACVVVSACALIAVVLVPLQKTPVYPYIMLFLLSLAVSTLVGDAVLHLIPEIIGEHKHGDEDMHEMNKDEEQDEEFFWKSICISIAMYFFFSLQTISQLFGISHGHSHDIGPIESTTKIILDDDEKVQSYKSTDLVVPSEKQEKKPINLSFVVRLLVAGALHNFTDGIALGASFAITPWAGISTAVAILCHEIPHEFGDVAMLLSIGYTMKKALLLNLITALFCFLGVTLGIFLAAYIVLRKWILAFTAGSFLYIGLVDMLPTVLGQRLPSMRLQFVIQHLGMIFGFIIMVLIVLIEEATH